MSTLVEQQMELRLAWFNLMVDFFAVLHLWKVASIFVTKYELEEERLNELRRDLYG